MQRGRRCRWRDVAMEESAGARASGRPCLPQRLPERRIQVCAALQEPRRFLTCRSAGRRECGAVARGPHSPPPTATQQGVRCRDAGSGPRLTIITARRRAIGRAGSRLIARTPLSVPVLMWAWLRMGLSPRQAAGGAVDARHRQAAMNLASTAAFARRPAAAFPGCRRGMPGLIRDSPEPFPITSPSVSMPAAASVAAGRVRPSPCPRSRPAGFHPAQRGKAVGAITLLDHLFMSAPRPRVIRVIENSSSAPVRRPSRTVPPRCPPTRSANAVTSALPNWLAAAARRPGAGCRRRAGCRSVPGGDRFDHGPQVPVPAAARGVRGEDAVVDDEAGERRLMAAVGDRRVGQPCPGSGRAAGRCIAATGRTTAVAHAAGHRRRRVAAAAAPRHRAR